MFGGEKMSKCEEPPPPVFTPDVGFLDPPPSYEEVMGVYQTSLKPVQEQQRDMPPLSYIDIMPRCLKMGNIKGQVAPTFDDFSAIMEGTNRWLSDHPGLQVWKCETVIRRIGVTSDGSLTYDLNDMLRADPTFGFVVYIRGLRLWLTKNTNPGYITQQLGLKNVVPEKTEIILPFLYNRHMNMSGGFDGDATVMQAGTLHRVCISFKNLYETIDTINEDLSVDPLQGTILTVETDHIKAYESFKNELDPERACWSEDKMRFKRETQVIRIFYILGPPAREIIGIKDFVPDISEQGVSTRQAKFESFEPFFNSIANWIPSNQGIRIVNIQQNDVNIDKFFGGNVEVSPEDTDVTISTFADRRVVQTFRLFYVKSTVGAQPAPLCITSRLFTPARTGTQTFETMTQTMERIDAWLKLTGVPIFTVCTIESLYSMHSEEGMDRKKTDYTIPPTSSKKWLTAIRVFFPAMFQEPDPSYLSPPPAFKSDSSSCNIL